ncbi:peptide-N4-asparagine amidase, partial [Enterococcus lactis]|uniref:peptide-N4-asparagine amidase n=1 Tax=Enterococcus lactis TaxID=357441 RepID=UPI003908102F
SLNAGIQYDRTGTIWVGGVPLWFGTTAEPAPNQAPSWHFERDVTDYTALLATAQTGFALIANCTNAQDTSIITSSARL